MAQLKQGQPQRQSGQQHTPRPLPPGTSDTATNSQAADYPAPVTNPWRSSAALSLLTKTLQGFGAITTTFVLNAWKLRRRAAFQIHQQICAHPNPSYFDHVPRLPHIENIKFMEPTLTTEQLTLILQRLLRLNPARPDLALRTFGRRRRHFQLMQQPPPLDIPAPITPQPPEANFTIGINNRPQLRHSLSLIASLPYCVCCLCGQDHSTPDCPPPSPQQPAHPHVCNLYTTYEDDPADDPVPNSLALPEHTWRALHWDVWNSQDPMNPPSSLPPAAQSPTTPLSPSHSAVRQLRHPPPSRKRHRPIVNPSQPTITQFFSAVSTPPPPALLTTTSNCEIALGPGSSLDPHD